MAYTIRKDGNGGSTPIALSATGNQAITIKNSFTELDGVTTVATGNRTIVLTIDPSTQAGDKLLIAWKTTGTETTAFSTGFSNVATVTGSAGKTFIGEFTYNKTLGAFVKTAAAPYQLD